MFRRVFGLQPRRSEVGYQHLKRLTNACNCCHKVASVFSVLSTYMYVCAFSHIHTVTHAHEHTHVNSSLILKVSIKRIISICMYVCLHMRTHTCVSAAVQVIPCRSRILRSDFITLALSSFLLLQLLIQCLYLKCVEQVSLSTLLCLPGSEITSIYFL